MNAKKITELALLTTIALIIFVVELRIPNPIPIPGAKLGLANIITVYAVYHYQAKEVALIILTRIILAAFFSGQIIALLYSLVGGFLCLLGMLIICRFTDEKHMWICSILGAVLHNVGQITVAVIITSSLAILAYFPFLLVSGCVAGVFTGLCAQSITHILRQSTFVSSARR